jgi:lipopolysaccharide transport system ATP-binding protein
MGEVAIRAEGLSKRYSLHHDRAAYGRLSESLANLARRPFNREGRTGPDEFWALRDVSFEIETGTAVGIIGPNGAGKSTLLKILSRITAPTTGRAILDGRVASLLEVGTGFHPELSGRENVFLSGAVLGMRRTEIQRRFDDIVEFSGIESQFLDTQVKFYSSGMQVRLGFAVAAHLEPDILVIDEVLAVGDARFQAKCLGKIEEMGQTGRTVIFVSHNMPSVLRLCSRAILLDHGRVVADGTAHEAVRLYLDPETRRCGERHWPPERAPGDGVARLKSVRVLPARGGSTEEIDIREPVDIEVAYRVGDVGSLRPAALIAVYNDESVCLFMSCDWRALDAEPGPRGSIVRSTCRIPGNFLAEGRVLVDVAVSTFDPAATHAAEREVVTFQVIDRSQGDGVRGPSTAEWPGVVRPVLEWRTEMSGPEAGADPDRPS